MAETQGKDALELLEKERSRAAQIANQNALLAHENGDFAARLETMTKAQLQLEEKAKVRQPCMGLLCVCVVYSLQKWCREIFDSFYLSLNDFVRTFRWEEMFSI